MDMPGRRGKQVAYEQGQGCDSCSVYNNKTYGDIGESGAVLQMSNH